MPFPSPKAANGTHYVASSSNAYSQSYIAGDVGYELRPAIVSRDGNVQGTQELIMPIKQKSYDKAQSMIRFTASFKRPSTVDSNILFNFGRGSGWEAPAGVFHDVMGRLTNGGGFWRKEQWQAWNTAQGIYANWADGNVGWKAHHQQVVRFNINIQRIEGNACVFRWYLTASGGSTVIWMTTAQGYWAHDISDIEDIRVKLDTPVGTGHYASELF